MSASKATLINVIQFVVLVYWLLLCRFARIIYSRGYCCYMWVIQWLQSDHCFYSNHNSSWMALLTRFWPRLALKYTANRRYTHSQPDLFILSADLYVDHDFLAAPNVALRNFVPRSPAIRLCVCYVLRF